MKALRVTGGVLLVLVAILAGLYWQNMTSDDGAPVATALSQTLNQCDLIASKAAASLPEALPFQKLEKAARQARVLDQCMHDQGYQENPAWVKHATDKAQLLASQQHVSENEAYETLRRTEMLQATADDHPLYWRKRS